MSWKSFSENAGLNTFNTRFLLLLLLLVTRHLTLHLYLCINFSSYMILWVLACIYLWLFIFVLSLSARASPDHKPYQTFCLIKIYELWIGRANKCMFVWLYVCLCISVRVKVCQWDQKGEEEKHTAKKIVGLSLIRNNKLL